MPLQHPKFSRRGFSIVGDVGQKEQGQQIQQDVKQAFLTGSTIQPPTQQVPALQNRVGTPGLVPSSAEGQMVQP